MGRKGFGAIKSISQKGRINPVASIADRISLFNIVIGTTIGLALFVAPLAAIALNDQEQTVPTSNNPAVNNKPAAKKLPAKVESTLKFESEVSGSSTNRTDVTVNGQKVPVPENGSYHKKIQSQDGTTTVDIENKSSGSGHSSSSLQLEFDN